MGHGSTQASVEGTLYLDVSLVALVFLGVPNLLSCDVASAADVWEVVPARIPVVDVIARAHACQMTIINILAASYGYLSHAISTKNRCSVICCVDEGIERLC